MRIDRVVVNASPLICLCKSGLSSILSALFNEIIVPDKVYQEIMAKDNDAQVFQTLFTTPQVKIVSDITVPASITSWDLGEGESSVLSFTLEHPNYWAVIDDREARRCAMTLGCRHTGTVGVIVLAKRRKIIPSVRECLNKLQSAGLWLSEGFIDEICQKFDED
jgi:predicted nucleic acid-binding protein